MMRILSILAILYVASYAAFRQTHIEVWAKDKAAYVIFPESAVGKSLYYFWRPLSYADGMASGVRFHIGPH